MYSILFAAVSVLAMYLYDKSEIRAWSAMQQYRIKKARRDQTDDYYLKKIERRKRLRQQTQMQTQDESAEVSPSTEQDIHNDDTTFDM